MTTSNTERARNRKRPTCFDRDDFPELVTVNDGWTWDGRRQLATVPNPMSKHCASWAVRAPDPDRPGDTGEAPATESIPGREGWLCFGCQHLPDDPRVIAKAKESEAA